MEDDEATAGGAAIGILGGLVAGGLLYYFLGPRCPKCNALLPPAATRCWSCRTHISG